MPRLPEPFAALATGSVNVDGTPYAILAYSHADEAAAAANADALRTLLEEGQMNTGRPWREWFGVDDIRVDGTTVTARLTLREAVPSAPYGLLSRSANIVTFR